MSDQDKERFSSEDKERFSSEENDVEAHRRRTEMTDDASSTEDQSSDDFEAHSRRAE